MKICPICDKRIEGTWCKNCHRLVTPWVIKDDIYINERHPAKENSCDYHNPHYGEVSGNSTSSGRSSGSSLRTVSASNAGQRSAGTQNNRTTQKNTSSQTTQRYTSSQPSQRYQSGGNSNSSQKGNKKPKAGLIIVLVYFAILIIGSVANSMGEIIDEVRDALSEYNFNVTPEYEEETKGSHETTFWKDIEFTEDTNPEHAFLNDIEPQYAEVDEYGWGYQYYDPDDIRSAGCECDGSHLDITMSELRTMAYDSFGSSKVDFVKNSDYTYNYREYYLSDDYLYDYEPTTFFEVSYYTDIDDLSLYVSADTASGRLHYYEFMSSEISDEGLKPIYLWFDTYYQDLFSSYDDFKDYVEMIKADGEYQYLEYGNNSESISIYCDDNFIDVTFMPY